MPALPATLTHAEASQTLEALAASVAVGAAPAPWVLDAAPVTHFDSSALSVLLAVKRQAKARGQAVEISNPPKPLLELAKLYGVEGLLGW